jgi:hypothetical protein
MSTTFVTEDGRKRVRTVSMEGRGQFFVVERKAGTLAADAGLDKRGWIVEGEVTSVNALSLHVTLSTLREVSG